MEDEYKKNLKKVVAMVNQAFELIEDAAILASEIGRDDLEALLTEDMDELNDTAVALEAELGELANPDND